MIKKIIYIILLLTVLFISSCDKHDFVSPYDPSYSLPAPTDLAIEQIAVNQCKLTWQDNSQIEAGFKISRKKDDEDWVENYATVTSNVEEFIDEDVLPNSEYSYMVLAYFEQIDSNNIENSIDTHITPPSNLEIVQISALSVKLTWEDNYQWEDGYKISRKKDDNDWTEDYAILEESSEEFIDDDYSSFSDYTYRVFAYYEIVTSDYAEKSMLSDFVLLPGGTFTMGRTSGSGESNELPTHQVTLSPFYISKYEVTQAQYEAVMNINPNHFSGSDKPVERVTWYNAVEYCNARSIQEGLTACYDTSDWSCDFSANGYRLPTEAEWEYAARGATNNPDYLYSGSDDIDNVAWYDDNSGSSTHDVGSKSPNSRGIYDMSGNVWEWCNDRYASYSNDSQTDPFGPSGGSYRVLRGGGWSNSASGCRVANRTNYIPSNSYYDIGFRVARSLN